MTLKFETKLLPSAADYLAPDGSEIRLLPSMKGGGLCHCTLPPHRVSKAMTHKRVEEIWYCLQGEGQMWRKQGAHEGEETPIYPGVSLTIPPGTHFQFRNNAREPLCFLIVTMPPWPGADEADPVPDHWQRSDEYQPGDQP